MMKLLLAGQALGLAGCATLAQKDEPNLTISDTSEVEFAPVAFQPVEGLADYKFANMPHKAEWVNCKATKAKATILVMHSEHAPFEKGKFCNAWVAQTFLSQSYDVISVNRPGYGASTGTPDVAGEQSLAATTAAVADALAKGKNAKPVTGIWGYDTGATAAALASKKLKGIKFLILGGGVYDFDDADKQTKDGTLKKDIEGVRKAGGEKAIEDRSVAYDVAGLPPVISIYHGKQDTTVPPTQAKAFADSLESAGKYKVGFQVIDGVAHDIPWTNHRKILEVLALSANP